MKLSNNGKKLIKAFEGCKLKAYQDAAGVWTIGYGHTSGVKSGQSITQDQADRYFDSDIVKFEDAVNRYRSVYNWRQTEFDAMVSFAFNIGNIVQLTNDGKRSKLEIANKIIEYCNAGGRKLAGLLNRRNVEKRVFTSDSYNPVTNAGIEELMYRYFGKRLGLETMDTVTKKITYQQGSTYKLAVNLNVREQPTIYARRLEHADLTENGKANDVNPKNGSLDIGTRVTCKDVEFDVHGNIWMLIPSGYVMAFNAETGETYVTEL